VKNTVQPPRSLGQGLVVCPACRRPHRSRRRPLINGAAAPARPARPARRTSCLPAELKPASRVPRSDERASAEAVCEAMHKTPRVLQPKHLPLVIPGYTNTVKTAISLPDDTYEQASRRAAELGISRSEFFARAARRYLDELASQSLTQQINQALQAADDDSNAAAVAVGRSYLAAQDDW